MHRSSTQPLATLDLTLSGWHSRLEVPLADVDNPVPRLQAIFFTPGSIAPYNSFKYMGCMIVGITLTHSLLYFPMWCAANCIR